MFDNFLPNKNLYRKYKISEGVKDDIGAMREVIYRRYFRSLMDGDYVPDLIVLDGGVSQINVCKEVLNSLHMNIPVCGLVKDDKHRTNHLLNENLELIEIDSHSNLFLYLSKIQEEVHRYAITYHRTIKAQGLLKSTLDMVPGIGEKRKKDLIRHFGSFKKMKEASKEELLDILPKDVAENLYNFLKSSSNN